MTNKTRKRSNALNWIGCVLLAVASLFILASLSANRSLRESQDALKAQGRPMTLDEITPDEIPEHENAALDIDSAVQQLKDETIGESDLYSQLKEAARTLRKNPSDPGALEEFRRFYESGAVAEALAVIEAGCLKEGYRSEFDLSQGASLKLPHLEELMSISRILAATVNLQASDGNQAAAWDTALTALRLANALESEPILVSQLVRAANIQTAIESIRSLDHAAAPASHLRELEDLLASFDDPAPFVAAIDGERIMGQQLFNASRSEVNLITGGPRGDLGMSILMAAQQVLPPLRSLDRSAHADAFREYAEAMAQPYDPSDLHLGERVVASVPPYSAITRMVTPAFSNVKKVMTSMFAEAHVTRAGLAVLEYRRQHGSYPPDLASLGGADLVDPFTGDPLVYTPDSTGFTISSVGGDFTIGIEFDAPADSDDIAWRYSEPPAALPGTP